jgi:preprotein translocase subunit SecE
MIEKLKLLVAGLMIVAGVAGYYLLADSPTVLRVLAVLAGLALATATAWFTVPGQQFFAFSQEAAAEARKVVWPTRKETMQMTGIVILFVIVMAIFLWMVDGLLFWLVQLVMGRGD